MPSRRREKPIITGENAKRFIKREQAMDKKRKSYAQTKKKQYEKVKSDLTNK